MRFDELCRPLGEHRAVPVAVPDGEDLEADARRLVLLADAL